MRFSLAEEDTKDNLHLEPQHNQVLLNRFNFEYMTFIYNRIQNEGLSP